MPGCCDARKSVFWYIIRPEHYRWFADKVKWPLRRAIMKYASKYPYPTEENLYHENSLVWLDLMKWFLAHDNNYNGRTQMLEAAFRVFIDELDHDIYYRRRADLILQLLILAYDAGKLKFDSGPVDSWPYQHCWKDDEGKTKKRNILTDWEAMKNTRIARQFSVRRKPDAEEDQPVGSGSSR